MPRDISIAEAGNCSDDTVAPTVDRTRVGGSLEAVVHWRGTVSSNPSPSTGESANLKIPRQGSSPLRWRWRTGGRPGDGLRSLTPQSPGPQNAPSRQPNAPHPAERCRPCRDLLQPPVGRRISSPEWSEDAAYGVSRRSLWRQEGADQAPVAIRRAVTAVCHAFGGSR